MRFAFINNNEVIKIEDHENYDLILDAFNFQIVLDITDLVPQPQVGWLYDTKSLYKNIEDVTPRQIRQALVISGISISSIETMLASLPEPMKSLATIEWEYSTLFIRNNNFVKSLGPLMGLTDDQLDSLWILAKRL